MKKQYKKILVILLFCTALMLIPSATAYAASGSGPEQGMFPDISQLFNKQLNNNVYLNKYRSNYYLDVKETGFFKSFDLNIFNGFANILFTLETWVAYIVIIIVYYAYQISFPDIFQPIIDPVTKSIQNTVFNQLSTLFIATLGIYYLVKTIRNQKTQVWIALIQTIAVVVVSLAFFNSPATVLKNVDQVSREVSSTILSGTFSATNAGKESSSAEVAACSNIWVMFVHKPWQILEFGDTTLAAKNEDKILSLAPGTDERQNIINDLAKDNEHFTAVWGLKRLAMIVLYLVPMGIMAAVIIILCLLIIIYDFLAIIVIMTCPVVFLIALIPWFGFKSVKGWFGKLIGYSSMKVIMSFFIAITLALTISLYGLSDKYGWFVVLILQVVIMWAVYWKRDKLFDYITAMRMIPQNHQMAKGYLNRGTHVEHTIRNHINKKIDGVNGKESKGSKGKPGNGNPSNGNPGSGKPTNGNPGGASQDPQNMNSPNKNDNSNKSTDDENFKIDWNDEEDTQRYETYEDEDTNNNSSQYDDLKLSEEILQDQYERSKASSEERAARTGKDPEYSYFVKSAMNREKMNLPRFDERDKMAVMNQIQRIRKAGGDPEALKNADYELEGNKSNEDVERPEGIVLQYNGQEETISPEEFEDFTDQRAVQKYTSDFNEEFGKNYSEGFMEGLVHKYGRNNVTQVIDSMKNINNKEGIKNPAGYLIKSLENNARQQEYSELSNIRDGAQVVSNLEEVEGNKELETATKSNSFKQKQEKVLEAYGAEKQQRGVKFEVNEGQIKDSTDSDNLQQVQPMDDTEEKLTDENQVQFKIDEEGISSLNIAKKSNDDQEHVNGVKFEAYQEDEVNDKETLDTENDVKVEDYNDDLPEQVQAVHTDKEELRSSGDTVNKQSEEVRELGDIRAGDKIEVPGNEGELNPSENAKTRTKSTNIQQSTNRNINRKKKEGLNTSSSNYKLGQEQDVNNKGILDTDNVPRQVQAIRSVKEGLNPSDGTVNKQSEEINDPGNVKADDKTEALGNKNAQQQTIKRVTRKKKGNSNGVAVTSIDKGGIANEGQDPNPTRLVVPEQDNKSIDGAAKQEIKSTDTSKMNHVSKVNGSDEINTDVGEIKDGDREGNNSLSVGKVKEVDKNEEMGTDNNSDGNTSLINTNDETVERDFSDFESSDKNVSNIDNERSSSETGKDKIKATGTRYRIAKQKRAGLDDRSTRNNNHLNSYSAERIRGSSAGIEVSDESNKAILEVNEKTTETDGNSISYEESAATRDEGTLFQESSKVEEVSVEEKITVTKVERSIPAKEDTTSSTPPIDQQIDKKEIVIEEAVERDDVKPTVMPNQEHVIRPGTKQKVTSEKKKIVTSSARQRRENISTPISNVKKARVSKIGTNQSVKGVKLIKNQ